MKKIEFFQKYGESYVYHDQPIMFYDEDAKSKIPFISHFTLTFYFF